MALADLGGLGAKEGAPVMYAWTVPNLLPIALPWLGILMLLALRANRRGQAWWMWLALGFVMVLGYSLQGTLDFLPSEVVDMLGQVIYAVAFGLAAVWLLAGALTAKSRFLTFLTSGGTLGGVSFLVYAIRQDWAYAGGESVAGLVALGSSVLALSVALHLGARACRGAWRPWWMTLWALALVTVIWLLITTPFFLVAAMTGPPVDWGEFLGPVLSVAFVCFLTLLPFLVLAFGNSFYRDRLKQLLHLGETPAPPPLLAPPVGLEPVWTGKSESTP